MISPDYKQSQIKLSQVTNIIISPVGLGTSILPTYLAEKLFFGSTWGFSLKLALSAKQHLLETIVT